MISRICALVEACWDELDAVAKKAPAELRKGPRGGGRDRDKIVDHVLGAESDAYAGKLAVKIPHPAIDDRKTIAANRRRGWTARYAARRIAWHALDHAWEIEDRTEL